MSFVYSVLIILCLLAIIVFAKEVGILKDDTIEIREIKLAAPPPPPPPPPQAQQIESNSTPSLDLSATGNGVAMEFVEMKMENNLELSELENPSEKSLPKDWNESLSVNWNSFGLGELDENPRLLTSIKIQDYPKALIRRKIFHVRVVLDVFIDETGQATLRGIKDNMHPELDSIIKRLVKRTRFSAPMKDGRPVRASFDWPLEFDK